MGISFLIFLVLLVLGIGWPFLASRQDRGDPRIGAAWLLGRRAPSQAATDLVARYLHRVRTHRLNGALAGSLLALYHGLARDQHIALGIGDSSPLGNVLFGGLAGLLVGSVLAETWRIRPRGPARQAEVSPRSPAPEATAHLPVVALLTGTTVLLAAWSPHLQSVLLAVVAGALLGVHHLTLRAVVERGRPALPDDLREADDAVRAFAGRRLSLETLAGAVLLAGWQVTTVEPPITEVGGVVVALAAWVGTIVLIWRSRPWPPKRLRAELAAIPAR